MRQEFLLYSLAETLSVDIDLVRSWPLTKVLGWKHYFEMKADAVKDQVSSSHAASDGGVHIALKNGRLVMQ